MKYNPWKVQLDSKLENDKITDVILLEFSLKIIIYKKVYSFCLNAAEPDFQNIMTLVSIIHPDYTI